LAADGSSDVKVRTDGEGLVSVLAAVVRGGEFLVSGGY